MRGRYELNETPARRGSRYRVEPGEEVVLDFLSFGLPVPSAWEELVVPSWT
jgi:hypothetical protein